MWMYAEVIDASGAVVIRTEGEVSEDGDLAGLVGSATNRFRQAHPERSLMTDVGEAGSTIRLGKAELANA